MSPYLAIVAINAALIVVAYAIVYPRLRPLTARRMMKADAVVTGIALAAAAALFLGRGIAFDIGPLPLRWWSYTLLTMLVIEGPAFWAFCKAYGVSLAEIDEPARGPRT